jgi:DNA repair protein RecO
VDFSETSRIVTFLTPARGKVACLARGARRAKGGSGPLLDTFNLVDMVYYWKDGRSVQNLGEVSLLDGFPGLKADLERALYAAFPLELAYKVAQENEPSEDLYARLVHGLESGSGWTGPADGHAAWLTLGLLTEAGFAPDLSALEEDAAGWSFDYGAAPRGTACDRRMDTQTAAALLAMQASPDACPDMAPGAAFGLVGGYAARQLETTFRSLRVLEQVFGPPAGRMS